MQPATNRKDIIFYDGTCGLCHGFVKWVLRHDREGKFYLSPLQGETIAQKLPAEERAKLPDSIVVKTSQGSVLARSQAVKYVAERLGMRGLRSFIAIWPRWLADIGYGMIANWRYRLFGRNEGDMCPIVPAELRARFLP